MQDFEVQISDDDVIVPCNTLEYSKKGWMVFLSRKQGLRVLSGVCGCRSSLEHCKLYGL